MRFWDRVAAMLRRDKAELDQMIAEANVVLDRKERDLHATPEEKMAAAQTAAEAADEEYEALKKKLDPG